MTKLNATITAVGGYVPEFVLTNKILESMVETNDQWIVSRTGIKERRILKGNELGSSFLAINAAKDLIAKKNIDPTTIDLVTQSCSIPTVICKYCIIFKISIFFNDRFYSPMLSCARYWVDNKSNFHNSIYCLSFFHCSFV